MATKKSSENTSLSIHLLIFSLTIALTCSYKINAANSASENNSQILQNIAQTAPKIDNQALSKFWKKSRYEKSENSKLKVKEQNELDSLFQEKFTIEELIEDYGLEGSALEGIYDFLGETQQEILGSGGEVMCWSFLLLLLPVL